MKVLSKCIVILFVSCILFSCSPYKKEIVEEIGTNETAFLVPLEGSSKEGQKQFMSIEYLNQAKVPTKRVSIPQRSLSLGRAWFNLEWIPTMKVIKVDRKPVTREWTADPGTGTSKTNQAIEVESRDSIGFYIGVNVTGLITEEDASKFLYYYAGKSLAVVIDENVRGKVSSILSREFGARQLSLCKSDKKEIQGILEKEVRDYFIGYGVTISNIGLVGGLTYTDPEIQKSINDAYTAEMKITQAENERLAQEKTNMKEVSIAVAQREAAQEFAKAQEAMVNKLKLEIEMKRAEALLEAAKKWNGITPANILPQGSNFLFGLDK